ncbi:hypothetical protein ASE86_13270 [Sphingomonas sp. Leaf33]|uniref:GTA-gp10 family protein n=1 Tax=Sphingomonas sp. Leaf33 TaxID=1736215 RepID=UPI0006FBD10C|nr:GTA-gp10 family protein [Sphingomonas sp. Leaf33]KQN19436.1 hypothetical protein ASE86_13270 [Sphingomonas sp. Leaf33]
MTDTRPAQRIEFANGTVLEIPRYDPRHRTDLWMDVFDGTYRFFLPIALDRELEEKCNGRAIIAIYGSVARGRYELEGKSVGFSVEGAASLHECLETIRLALIGGGTAIVDGMQVRIDATRAKQLVDVYLAPAPVEASWDLAYMILHTLVHGRMQRPEEDGTTSKTAVRPSYTLAGQVDAISHAGADATMSADPAAGEKSA